MTTKLTLGELTTMAGMAGIDMYTAWGVSDDALMAFSKALVERCAVELERVGPAGSMKLVTDGYVLAIRSLMED